MSSRSDNILDMNQICRIFDIQSNLINSVLQNLNVDLPSTD